MRPPVKTHAAQGTAVHPWRWRSGPSGRARPSAGTGQTPSSEGSRHSPLPTDAPNTAVCRRKSVFTKKTAFGTLSGCPLQQGITPTAKARAGEEESLATLPHCTRFPAVGCRFFCFPRQLAEKGKRVAIRFPPMPGRDVEEIKVSLKCAVEAKSVSSIDNTACI